MPSSAGSAATFCSNPDRVGRDGFLDLRFERREAGTYLSQCRFTLPLQALTPAILDDGTAYLMLLNPTGGVLGDDRLRTRIVQERETHVCLTTPSATRVYRTAHGPAVQETSIRLNAGASLEYLPDHIIPHADSALRQTTRVELARTSRAILLDSFAAGRVARGERWKFRELDLRMEVFICGKPAYLNRMKIVPTDISPQHAGVMSEFNYMGCLGLFAGDFENWKPVIIALNDELQKLSDVLGGVSLLAFGGCVIKVLARSAADLIEANKRLWSIARELVMHLPPFDLRKY